MTVKSLTKVEKRKRRIKFYLDPAHEFAVVAAVDEDLSIVAHGFRENGKRTRLEFVLFSLLKLLGSELGLRFVHQRRHFATVKITESGECKHWLRNISEFYF